MRPGKTEMRPPVAIAILAKAPIPGLAKTRLITDLGAEGAAALQGWLLQRTVATALRANIGPVTLWCAPDVGHPAFVAQGADHRISLRRQPAGDLGQRMHQAIADSPCPAGTLVIGTDCPLLNTTHLQQAATALSEHQATVIPAEDGGYVLIGMRDAAHQVFAGIEWSTERVMAETRQRLTSTGWTWAEFAPLWDVDRSNDFTRLLQHLPEARHLAPMPVTL
jgi:uncharacterized protein